MGAKGKNIKKLLATTFKKGEKLHRPDALPNTAVMAATTIAVPRANEPLNCRTRHSSCTSHSCMSYFSLHHFGIFYVFSSKESANVYSSGCWFFIAHLSCLIFTTSISRLKKVNGQGKHKSEINFFGGN